MSVSWCWRQTAMLALGAALLGQLLAGCAHEQAPASAAAQPEALAWVAQDVVGGRQCESGDPWQPPDPVAQLERAGISVYDVQVQPQAVCMACGCPAYAATHWVRIADADLEAAARIHYRPRER